MRRSGRTTEEAGAAAVWLPGEGGGEMKRGREPAERSEQEQEALPKKTAGEEPAQRATGRQADSPDAELEKRKPKIPTQPLSQQSCN